MVAGRPLAPIGAAAIGATAPVAALAPIAAARSPLVAQPIARPAAGSKPDDEEMSDFEEDGEEAFTEEPEGSDEMSDFEEDQDGESGAWSLEDSRDLSAGLSPGRGTAPTPKPTAVATARPTAIPTARATAQATSRPTATATATATAKPAAAGVASPAMAVAKPTAVATATAKPTATATATAKPAAVVRPSSIDHGSGEASAATTAMATATATATATANKPVLSRASGSAAEQFDVSERAESLEVLLRAGHARRERRPRRERRVLLSGTACVELS